MQRKLKDDNQGVATIVAVIVSVIVLMLSLSLLLAAYSLFSSTARKSKQAECKELAKSLAIQIDKEITTGFENYSDQKQSLENGENSIWFYLRYNLWNDSIWPYYCEEESAHRKEVGYRYFNLDMKDVNGSDYKDVSADVSVCMYWKCDKNTYDANIKEETPLCIEIHVSMGEQSYVITSTYLLSVGMYTDVEQDVLVDVNSNVNPTNNPIDVSEKWQWVFETRE